VFLEQAGIFLAMTRNTQNLQNSPNREEVKAGEKRWKTVKRWKILVNPHILT